MIIQQSISMSPGQPLFEFLMESSRRYEALDPESRKLAEPIWERFRETMADVHRAHAAQPKIPEGTWFLRHTVEAARQDVSACAAIAFDVAHEVKDTMTDKGMKEPALEKLAEYAIAFTRSVREDPRILSIQVQKPSPAATTPEPPLI